jgi:hypothetical protein
MDENVAISRILEVPNLTDELEDDEANLLIDWASKNVGKLIEDVPDEDAAGEKVNDLMEVMRKINRLAALRKQRTPEQIQAEVDQFGATVEKAFGAAPAALAAPAAAQADAPEGQPLAAALKEQSDKDFVQSMIALAQSSLNLVAPPASTPAMPTTTPTTTPTTPATPTTTPAKIVERGDAEAQSSSSKGSPKSDDKNNDKSDADDEDEQSISL